MPIPPPRMPRCYVHHVWHANCQACHDQHVAEREQARKRLEEAER